MSPFYLLDTNIVSYALKGLAFGIETRLRSLPPTSFAISAITAAELRFWIARHPGGNRLRVHIENFLVRVTTLPWDGQVAAIHGELKAGLYAVGRPMGELDMQIAAHALSLNAVLVTHDAAFSRIPNLKVEDWVD